VRRVTRLVSFVLLGLTAVFVTMMAGLRLKWPPVLDAIRRLNRAATNRWQMHTAGTPGAYAGVVRHRGRHSGRMYETPVVPVRTDDGFVIALPYDLRSDWMKNVLTSGSATIVHEGRTHEVERPEVIPMTEANPFFGPQEQRMHQRFHVEHCLRVRFVEPDGAAAASVEGSPAG
jgi:hypothetical protein